MATFTISLTVGAQTVTFSKTYTNTNAQRVGPAYRSIYNLPTATDQAVWDALGAGVAKGIEANVIAQERANETAAIVIGELT